jgi:hypothetical protein
MTNAAMLTYSTPIVRDVDVIVKQLWKGAPKEKRARALSEVDIAVAVTKIDTEDTIDGSSTLTITLVDTNWRLLDSGFFDPDDDGRPDPIDVNYPQGSRFWWRLANTDVSSDHTITLTFIERVVAYLMHHKGVKKASRASMTRAQFIKSLADEVQAIKIDFRCHDLKVTQKIAPSAPVEPTLRLPLDDAGKPVDVPVQRKPDKDKKADKDPGIAYGADIKIKGIKADKGQIDQINRSLGQADKDNAGRKARKSLVVAAIGESSFRAIRNQGNPPSRYWGVFQGSMDIFKIDDTEKEAHYFLVGGKGYQGGGAIYLAKANPGMSPGAIATRVEGSGEDPSFYDVCPPGGNYNAGEEADAILAEYGAGGGGSGAGGPGGTTYRKQFNFSRDKGEDSWEAMTRLAGDVKWPLFADGNRLYFDPDTTLIDQKPSALLHRDDPLVVSFSYTVALRKFATEMSLTLICDPDAYRAGEVFKLVNFGMASKGKYKGKWLITDITRDRAEITSDFTLRQPITPSLETAAELGTRSSSGGAGNVVTMAPGITPSAVTTSGGGAYGAGRSYGGHAGVDISMPEGTKLAALCAGTVACVSHSWYRSSNGKGQGMISIKSDRNHGGFPAGTIFGYGHPDVIYKKVGDKVEPGDKLALSGAPGGGAHLHFFINTAGDACSNGNVNPTAFAKDSLSHG